MERCHKCGRMGLRLPHYGGRGRVAWWHYPPAWLCVQSPSFAGGYDVAIVWAQKRVEYEVSLVSQETGELRVTAQKLPGGVPEQIAVVAVDGVTEEVVIVETPHGG